MEVELEELVISIFRSQENKGEQAFDTSDLKQLFESLLIIFWNEITKFREFS